MDNKVLSRFIKLVALATFVMFSVWMAWQYLAPDHPGDYHVRQGGQRLAGGSLDSAMQSFNRALEVEPGHRGALMGRALVYMESGDYAQAEAELSALIDMLHATLDPDDRTGIGALAAAYANRGILHDRQGRYETALEDYIRALKVDEGAVSGPGLADKILHDPNPATVRRRAEYIHQQLQLPEEERVMSIPEIDAKQRPTRPR